MQTSIEIDVDVTDVVAIGQEARIAATVHVPDGPLSDPPVVAFAFPGGGYCRRYFSFDMPDAEDEHGTGGQAGFHTDRGWIVVAVDSLGFGDSTVPDGHELTLNEVALGNLGVVEHVRDALAAGDLGAGIGVVPDPVLLGIGQSMGGCFTIVLQGRHAPFDGVAILGYSGIHTVVPSRPGTPPMPWPWIPRDADPTTARPLNWRALPSETPVTHGDEWMSDPAAAAQEHPFRWAFHYDDVPDEVVYQDLMAGVDPAVEVPIWKSLAIPSCGRHMVAPGVVAIEAAAIDVPVLSATGERDVVPDPRAEPRAFMSSPDVTVYVCERMAHMHNFASTRVQFWQRIHAWGSTIATSRRD